MVWILNHKITLYKGKYFHQCFVKHKQKPNINSLNTLWSDWNLEKIDRDVCSSDRNSCPNVIWLTFLNSCFLRMLIIITVGNVLKYSYRNSFKILYDYCSWKNFMSITIDLCVKKETTFRVGHFTTFSGHFFGNFLRFWRSFWDAQCVEILIGWKAATKYWLKSLFFHGWKCLI